MQVQVQVLVAWFFFWETEAFSKEDVQGWSCGSYGIIKSWLACIICSQPPAGINQSQLLIRQTHANANNGRRDIEAPFGAG